MKKLPVILSIFIGSIFAQDDPWPGYTLIDPLQDTLAFVIDLDHHILHTWHCRKRPASIPYLMPDSTLIRPCVVDEPTLMSGGVGGTVEIIDWDSSILWSYTWSDSTYQHHHDIQPMPNGNILVLVWERIPYAEAVAAGREDISADMWPETILEVQPVGTDEAEVVWEWHLWDHIIQDRNPNLDNYGVVAEHPELLDINYGELGDGPFPDCGDWIHANHLAYHPERDQIAMTSRHTSEFYIIDHSTTAEEAAGHTGGNSGKGGDFLYRWGNPRVYDRGEEEDQWFYAPHAATWVWADSPGAGNIIVFNNGRFRPDGNYSSVDELTPPMLPDGTYTWPEMGGFLPETAEIVYVDQETFFSQAQSSAYRLPNGNTLICESSDARVFEVNPAGLIVWEYLHPAGIDMARAMRYGLDYIEIGCPAGDPNGDGTQDILDIVLMVTVILATMEPDSFERCASDFNLDGNVDILDVVGLLNFILRQEE